MTGRRNRPSKDKTDYKIPHAFDDEEPLLAPCVTPPHLNQEEAKEEEAQRQGILNQLLHTVRLLLF